MIAAEDERCDGEFTKDGFDLWVSFPLLESAEDGDRKERSIEIRPS